MISKRKALNRIFLIGLMLFILWFACKMIGCGHSITQSSPNIPAVSSVFPAADSKDISLSARVMATFDRSIDPATITDTSFILSSAEAAVSGTITYEADAKTATFIPSKNLVYNTKYTAVLSTAIKDVDGHALAQAYSWSFTTLSLTPLEGVLDPSFGTDGVVIYNSASLLTTGETNTDDQAKAVLVDPNGKIIVVGNSPYMYIFSTMTIWRFNSDGTLDTTFGKNGIAMSDDSLLVPNDYKYYGMAVTLDSLDRIVVAGYAAYKSNRKMVVWRFDSSGNLDAGFGGDGVVEYNCISSIDGANAVAIDPAGRILVAGSYNSRLGLWCLNSDGTLDTLFGTNGKVTRDEMGSANAIVIDAGGKIVVAGGETNFQMNIWRFNDNGALDSTFGSSGIVTYSASCRGDAMMIDSTGKILVAGYLFDYSGGTMAKKMAVWRYSSSGEADTTFGANGLFSTGEYDGAKGIVIDQYDKILIAGTRTPPGAVYGEMALWRLNANGMSDTGFGSGGVMNWNFPNAKYTTDEYAQGESIALDPTGKIYVAGYVSYPDSDRDVVLVKIK
mgnify:CR=1 FL=1